MNIGDLPSTWIDVGRYTDGPVSFHTPDPKFREVTYPTYAQPHLDTMHMTFTMSPERMASLGPDMFYAKFWADILNGQAALNTWENEGGTVR